MLQIIGCKHYVLSVLIATLPMEHRDSVGFNFLKLKRNKYVKKKKLRSIMNARIYFHSSG